MKPPLVFLSKYNWKEGMSGVDILFNVGEKALYRARNGVKYPVVVKSELKSHNSAPGLVRELLFLESPEGPNVLMAVDADRLEPIL